MTSTSSKRIKALAVGAAITCMLGGVGVANATGGADDAPGHLQHTGTDDGARNSTDDNPKPAAVANKTTVAKKTVLVAKAKPAAVAAHRSSDDGPTHHSSGVEDSPTHRSSGVHHGAGTDDSSVSHRRGRDGADRSGRRDGSTASRSTDDSTISGKNRVSDDSPDSPDDSDISGKGASTDD